MLPMATKLTTGLPSTTATSRWMNMLLSITTASNGKRRCTSLMSSKKLVTLLAKIRSPSNRMAIGPLSLARCG